jgi:hypothetical protein
MKRGRPAGGPLGSDRVVKRQAAKVLGVHLKTVQRDLTQNASGSDAKSATGSMRHRAKRYSTTTPTKSQSNT